eukprot:141041-Chlamydomonas_euryale.AAC.7
MPPPLPSGSPPAKTLPQLCAAVQAGASCMGADDWAAAYGALARLYRGCTMQLQDDIGAGAVRAQRQAVRLELVLPAATALHAQVPRLAGHMLPRHASQALWSMSVAHCYERAVFDTLCMRCVDGADDMAPHECAMAMLAFGRLRHYHPELLRLVPQV